MDLGTVGKQAIVSATSKGLRRACAFALAREGVNLVICARRVEPLQQTWAPTSRRPRDGVAHRFNRLIRDGAVTDRAEVARVGHVTRALVRQIMNLLHLAPDIQEELLFLPLIERGRDSILERHLRPIAAVSGWRKQRRLWRELQSA